MLEKIFQTIEEEKLIERKQHIILGLSGGADSIFLFKVLLEYRKIVPFTLICCHINHGLRGDEAFRDEEFCREICRKHKIPFFAFRVNVKEFSREQKIATEEAGRIIRYDRFHRIAEKYPDSIIATAHHSDDQVETILQNLIRGSALKGLTGMDYRRENIIRPLLDIKKEEIISFLKENNISFCTDSTNEENEYNRNKIRNLIIPSLEKYNPNFKEGILRMSKSLKREEEYLDKEVEILFRNIFQEDPDGDYFIDLKSWEALPENFKYRVLLKILDQLKGHLKDIGQGDLDRIIGLFSKRKGKKELAGEYIWLKDHDRIWIYRDEPVIKKEKSLFLDEECTFNGYIIKAWKINKAEIKKKGSVYFSGKIFNYDLSIRNRKDGDRFYPYNGPGEKKLKDFFIDEKIPQFKRDRIPLLICNDKIIWIPSIRRSNWFLPQEDEEEVIQMYWRKL